MSTRPADPARAADPVRAVTPARARTVRPAGAAHHVPDPADPGGRA